MTEKEPNHTATVTTATNADAIVMDQVTVTRDTKNLVTDIDLRIPAGTHWSILGPNGAGKTTLLKMMSARMFPSNGTAQILGEALGKVNTLELRKRIGHVDPKQRLNDLSAYEAVLSGVSGSNGFVRRFDYTEDMKAEANSLLELVGMDRKAEQTWRRMSQGEKARTLIARALVTDPELLLLDEPSTGLDLPGRETLLKVIDKLRAERPNVATVLITHHVEEIAQSTTNALLIKNGRILSSGPVKQVLTAEHLSELYDMDVRLEQLNGRWFAFQG